jgi:hypothetical protein
VSIRYKYLIMHSVYLSSHCFMGLLPITLINILNQALLKNRPFPNSLQWPWNNGSKSRLDLIKYSKCMELLFHGHWSEFGKGLLIDLSWNKNLKCYLICFLPWMELSIDPLHKCTNHMQMLPCVCENKTC